MSFAPTGYALEVESGEGNLPEISSVALSKIIDCHLAGLFAYLFIYLFLFVYLFIYWGVGISSPKNNVIILIQTHKTFDILETQMKIFSWNLRDFCLSIESSHYKNVDISKSS